MSDDQIAKARRFYNLHHMPGMFLMPDAWNAESARMLQAAGFPAIATTQSGIAESLGLGENEECITLRQTIEAIHAIAGAIDLPLSADFEAGYGATPEDVAEAVWRAIDVGAVGGTISDHSGVPGLQMFDVEQAADRIAAARDAADGTEIKYTLTAQIDCYLTNMEAPFAAVVRRAALYRAAGADCLFVPGVSNLATIASLAREINAPLAVAVGNGNNSFAIADLRNAGVKRVNLGGSLARATLGLIRRAAEEMMATGTFNFANDLITGAESSRPQPLRMEQRV